VATNPRSLLVALAVLAAPAISCGVAPIVGENAEAFLFRSPATVDHKIRYPFVSGARLAVLWVGHATVLVQMDDKLILTDPVFGPAGQVASRLVEAGIDPADLPPLDAVVVSHLHPDHFSLGSLETIEDRVRMLLLPPGGLGYLPRFPFESDELATWTSWERGGLRITAVPVRHSGFRYGIDDAWMKDQGFTGYVLQYHGLTVYFGGDTAYAHDDFVATRARFPPADLALLPIAPIHPREFMENKHMDPKEAVQAFVDLGAQRMMPVHFDTFINSTDAPGEPVRVLRAAMAERHLEDRLAVLAIGEQRILLGR
jgi:N-acyl-phosphatidylethanolamine-hydrolysing phospholipase D